MLDHVNQSKESTHHTKTLILLRLDKTLKDNTVDFSMKLSPVLSKIWRLSPDLLVKTLTTMLFSTPVNMVLFYLILGRKNVVACHKAGIMKMGDGLFINVAAEVSTKYP